MARPIILSNGELHVGINKYGLVHDLYFPYVGFENHAAGQSLRHHVGVWVDGQTSWLDSGEWQFTFRYPSSALVGHTLAKNERIGVLLEFDDVVDSYMSAFMRNVHVVNLRDQPREIRLFMHQAFVIGDARSNTDTGQYLPESHAILHYRGRRAFIIGGTADGVPFDQYTVGLFGIEGWEGTFRDAEDGQLSFNNVEHGRVDSTIGFSLHIDAHSSKRAHYWMAAGTSMREALYVHNQVLNDGLLKRLHMTAGWWREWLGPTLKAAEKISPKYRDNFIRSAMLVKAHIDKRGAVIASTDTAVLNYSRDAYAYCWPRDGAYAIWPLIRMGYVDEPHRFFEFCQRGLHAEGYLMHKYRADGALGSSWHPYIQADGLVTPPIQEDETALVLFVFARYYRMNPNPRVLREFYHTMITPMANFMVLYIDETTGLPKPSYDLWEQVHLTTTYTTALVYAALLAAADLAEIAEDPDNAVKWRTAAEDIQQAALKHLYNSSRRAFYKGLKVINGELQHDETIDTSSIFGVFMFGLFPTQSDQLQSAIATMKEVFAVRDDNAALPRFENDGYYRADPHSQGNAWMITTLWLAQYSLEIGDMETAEKALSWVSDRAFTTGTLPEQVNTADLSLVSVAPLAWSQAEYIATLLDTITEQK